MKTRVITGIFIAIAAIGIGLLGGIYLAALMCVCSCIGFLELCNAFEVSENRKLNAPAAIGFIITIVYYLGLVFPTGNVDKDLYTLISCVALLIALLAVYVLTFPKYTDKQIVTVFFSFVYCPVLLSFVYRARLMPYGLYLYALLFFSTWICDTCAYFAGRAFGKHKLAPVLSPKKTIEGSIGGVLGSVVLCLLLAAALRVLNPGEERDFTIVFMVIGFVGSIVSQIGDLAASAIKRNHNIKDYGSCLPGHGGIMDRFDSLIFTTPIIYFIAVVFMGIK